MKVQSWRYLAIALALMIAAPVYAVYRAAQGNGSFFGGGVAIFSLSVNLLYTALSEKRYQKEQKRLAENRRILREMFGGLALLASYMGMALLFLALGASLLLDSPWPALALLFLALVYSVWLAVAMNRRRKRGAEAEAPPDDRPLS